jgi:hypothetical protein
VILLEFVQADRPHQIDLDFVTRGDAADQVLAGLLHGLRHRQDRRDVVAGMAVIGGKERVVIIQFAYCGAVCPCRPFGAYAACRCHAEHRSAAAARMSQRHVTRRHHRTPVDRCNGNRGVVDDAIDDHRGDIAFDRDLVGGDRGNLPGELIVALQVGGGGMNFDRVGLHAICLSDVSLRRLRRHRFACGQAPQAARGSGRAMMSVKQKPG